VAPGQATSFTLQYPASSAGSASGTFQFGNSDPNNNPFAFTVTAQAVVPVASIDALQLVSDTGVVGDRITSDPRVSGTANGNFSGGSLVAQFQYSTDA
jgi:hypothetical protein